MWRLRITSFVWQLIHLLIYMNQLKLSARDIHPVIWSLIGWRLIVCWQPGCTTSLNVLIYRTPRKSNQSRRRKSIINYSSFFLYWLMNWQSGLLGMSNHIVEALQYGRRCSWLTSLGTSQEFNKQNNEISRWRPDEEWRGLVIKLW